MVKKHHIKKKALEEFEKSLRDDEKSPVTIEKYMRDVRVFTAFCGCQAVTKELVMTYKSQLVDSGRYAVGSINSMLSSVNSFLRFMGWDECRVKAIRTQRQLYCAREKELTKAEYERLLAAAGEVLRLIIQTICGTGIRVSELAYFFDRDGTINVDIGYLHRPEDIQFIEGVPELIRRYNDGGWLVIVVTNQSGIARGMFTEQDMQKVHAAMNERLRNEYGAHIDAFYFCPHLPEITGECGCRKPKPGLFLRAIKDHDIDPTQSVSYGDSERDEAASRAAGISYFQYVPLHLNGGF